MQAGYPLGVWSHSTYHRRAARPEGHFHARALDRVVVTRNADALAGRHGRTHVCRSLQSWRPQLRGGAPATSPLRYGVPGLSSVVDLWSPSERAVTNSPPGHQSAVDQPGHCACTTPPMAPIASSSAPKQRHRSNDRGGVASQHAEYEAARERQRAVPLQVYLHSFESPFKLAPSATSVGTSPDPGGSHALYVPVARRKRTVHIPTWRTIRDHRRLTPTGTGVAYHAHVTDRLHLVQLALEADAVPQALRGPRGDRSRP